VRKWLKEERDVANRIGIAVKMERMNEMLAASDAVFIMVE
jgi:hypothetical protein